MQILNWTYIMGPDNPPGSAEFEALSNGPATALIFTKPFFNDATLEDLQELNDDDMIHVYVQPTRTVYFRGCLCQEYAVVNHE
jgi:hypothetical protein